MSSSPTDAADAMPPMRALARSIFLQALAETTVAKAFAKNLEYSRGVLRICDDLYDLHSFSRVVSIALGKASYAMAQALTAHIGASVEGILVEPAAQLVSSSATTAETGANARSEAPIPGFRRYPGGHPWPTSGSIVAAKAVLSFIESSSAHALVIFLLSGGGSSMLETPLYDEVGLADLIAVYRALVFSGAPIAEINAVRKHLSAIKGGRLAQAAHNNGAARQVSIMVSDVPDKTPDALASGPTMPDPTTAGDCFAIAARYRLLPQFPPPVRALFEKRVLEETPKSDDLAFHDSRWWPVLSNATLLQAAAALAARGGWAVEIDRACDDWDYARAADYLLDRLRQMRRGVSRACLISGGEVLVTVPPEVKPGAGGRNQHFALYCSQKIAGENIAVLSAGSDGIDGTSSAAGAIADGATLARAGRQNLHPASALAGFDSASFFAQLGDAIVTGPTGNNLRDLRILLAW